MQGWTKYTTTTGIRVGRLHYSAHPDFNPDEPDGVHRIQQAAKRYGPSGMEDPKWRREMEIDFHVRGSARVWPDFLDRIQPRVTCAPFEIEPYWIVKAGYDYGHTNPFAFLAAACESEHRIYICDELYLSGCDVYKQAKMIRERPYWNQLGQIIGDPTIWRRDQHQKTGSGQSEARSIGSIFEEMDVQIDRGNAEPGTDIAFRDLLNSVLWRDLDNPQVMIFSTCKNLLRELRLLRYREWLTKESRDRSNNPEEIVSKQNHAWDAFKYLMLATHAEAPDRLDFPKGSWGRLFREIQSMRRREALVLG